MKQLNLVLPLIILLVMGCWDNVSHEYDDNVGGGEDTGVDSVTEQPSGSDTATDIDTSQSDTVPQNSLLSAEWAGFGTPCDTHDECGGYPSNEKRCIQNVMNIINAPGGYCTGCCNTPGKDECAPGIDCVGVSGAYLICIERCANNDDCRTEGNWECRDMYVIPDAFPRQYCLPIEEYAAPSDEPGTDITCPWPWN